MTDKKTEALKLALEALEQWNTPLYKRKTAITAIREALAEQQSGIKQVIELYDSPEQPAQQQEPFGYFRYDLRLDAWVQNREGRPGTPLYTSPPASKPWVGLTLGEAVEIWTKTEQLDTVIKLVEAKLKEKNTGETK